MSITTSIAQAMQSVSLKFIDPELESPSSTTSQHLPPPSYDPQNPDSLFLIAFAARHPLLSSSPPASARSSMESIDFEDNRYRLFSSSLFSGDDDDFDYTPTPTTPGQPLIPVWPEELQIVEEPTPMLPEVEVPLSPPTTPGCATPIRSDEEFGVVKPDPRRSHRREKSWRGTMKRLFTRRSL